MARVLSIRPSAIAIARAGRRWRRAALTGLTRRATARSAIARCAIALSALVPGALAPGATSPAAISQPLIARPATELSTEGPAATRRSVARHTAVARQAATAAPDSPQSPAPDAPAAKIEQIATIRAPHAEIELAPLEIAGDGTPRLRLTMRPRAGIHIYAPGQRGYYPIELTFEPAARLAAGRLELPAPEPYTFAPTGERFLVYRQPFALTQHVRRTTAAPAASSRRARAVSRARTPQPNAPQPNAPQPNAPQPNAPQPNAPQPNAPQPSMSQPGAVRATLHYQACDEQVCYRPVTVPLVWTHARDAASAPRR